MLVQSHLRIENGKLPAKGWSASGGKSEYSRASSVPNEESSAHLIHLLPSLPAENWPNGYIRGIKARGGYVVDIEWRGGKLTRAAIRSKLDGTCSVRYGDKSVDIPVKAGGTFVLDGELTVE